MKNIVIDEVTQKVLELRGAEIEEMPVEGALSRFDRPVMSSEDIAAGTAKDALKYRVAVNETSPVEVSSRLSEKQQYYRYGASGWTYKQPPRLDSFLHEQLSKIGSHDEHGDPLYRLTWGGVAVVRNAEDDAHPILRGDKSGACIKLYPKDGGTYESRLEPRYLHGRAKQPKWLCYRDKDGHIVRTINDKQVMPAEFTWWEFEYVSFGRLFWFIERKLSPEHLVAASIYEADDPNIPRSGDYIEMLRLRTPDELYYEPDERLIAEIAGGYQELQNESLSDLRISDALEREEFKANEESALKDRETAEFDDLYGCVVSAPTNRIILLPN